MAKIFGDLWATSLRACYEVTNQIVPGVLRAHRGSFRLLETDSKTRLRKLLRQFSMTTNVRPRATALPSRDHNPSRVPALLIEDESASQIILLVVGQACMMETHCNIRQCYNSQEREFPFEILFGYRTNRNSVI